MPEPRSQTAALGAWLPPYLIDIEGPTAPRGIQGISEKLRIPADSKTTEHRGTAVIGTDQNLTESIKLLKHLASTPRHTRH